MVSGRPGRRDLGETCEPRSLTRVRNHGRDCGPWRGPVRSRGGPAHPRPRAAVAGHGLVTLETAEPTEALHRLTDWALRRGTVLDQLTVDRASLEDVYLRLTSDSDSDSDSGMARRTH